MTCQQLQAQFDDRLDEQLEAADRAAFDAHLQGCAACRRHWQEYAAAWQTLARHESIAPSVGFAERTLRRLTAEPEPVLARWWRPGVRWALLGTATVGLAVMLWVHQQRAETEQLVELYSEIRTDEPLDDLEIIAWLHELEGDDQL